MMREKFTIRFKWLCNSLACLLLASLTLDNFAHKRGLASGGESFFTIWHLMTYVSLTMLGFSIIFTIVKYKTLPLGYRPFALGTGLFFVAGGGDFMWHSIFGFEKTIDLFWSPPHLLIGISLIIMFITPIRIASKITSLELISFCGLFVEISQMFDYQNPFVRFSVLTTYYGNADRWVNEAIGISGILFSSLVLVIFLRFLRQKYHLFFGVCTVLLGIQSLVMVLLGYHLFLPLVLVGVVSGLLADYLFLKKWFNDQTNFPLILIVYNSLYFLILRFLGDFLWSTSLILGIIAISGVIGFLINFLWFGSAQPVKETEPEVEKILIGL